MGKIDFIAIDFSSPNTTGLFRKSSLDESFFAFVPAFLAFFTENL